MTALERQLIGMGLGALLVLAAELTGLGTETWQFWLVMVGAAVAWSHVAGKVPPSSLPAESSACSDRLSEQSCSGAWDWDLDDSPWS